jgi:hypothetical protein
MNQEWYIIKDIEEFVDKTRTLIFNNFGGDKSTDIDTLLDSIKPEDQAEFDSVLSHDESMVIMKSLVKKQINKKTNQTRYIMSDDIFYEIIQRLNDRMVSNLLNSLVNKGIVDTAFDNDSNDFVFWIKNEKSEKPETD